MQPCSSPRPSAKAFPLSERAQRQLLRGLLDRARNGDTAAAEALIRLGRETGSPYVQEQRQAAEAPA